MLSTVEYFQMNQETSVFQEMQLLEMESNNIDWYYYIESFQESLDQVAEKGKLFNKIIPLQTIQNNIVVLYK